MTIITKKLDPKTKVNLEFTYKELDSLMMHLRVIIKMFQRGITDPKIEQKEKDFQIKELKSLTNLHDKIEGGLVENIILDIVEDPEFSDDGISEEDLYKEVNRLLKEL